MKPSKTTTINLVAESGVQHISSSILNDLGRTLWRLTLAVESVATALKESK